MVVGSLQNKNNNDSSVVILVGITYLLDHQFKSKCSVAGIYSLSCRLVFFVVENFVVESSVIMRRMC